jgi:hypothetical protein
MTEFYTVIHPPSQCKRAVSLKFYNPNIFLKVADYNLRQC